MINPNDEKPKPLPPVFGITAGFCLLVAAGALLIFVVLGLKNGHVLKISRLHPGLVARAERPGEFWYSEIFALLIGSALAFGAARILRSAFRQMRWRATDKEAVS
jgi:hypothetical protein